MLRLRADRRSRDRALPREESCLSVDVVIPTTRPSSLERLLATLEKCAGDSPGIRVVDGRGRSAAAARNAGWRASRADWIAFLDDDVIPTRDWVERLHADLADLPGRVAGSQGRLTVPLPPTRRPTDWERNVKELETARWATADMAYRRSVLDEVGGFDERFPRAYREDSDLALRVLASGYELVTGTREVIHPVARAGFWTSVRKQAGNADDALMKALHGAGWRDVAGARAGRLRRHVAMTAAGSAAAAAALAGHRRLALVGVGGWLAGVGELAWARIQPGPRTPREVATMAVTSAAIPPAASLYAASGRLRARRLTRQRPEAVLLHRDGTLIEDVPYNRDPARVVPAADARPSDACAPRA